VYICATFPFIVKILIKMYILLHRNAEHLLWIYAEEDDDAPEQSVIYNRITNEYYPLKIENFELAKEEFLNNGWTRAYIPDINLVMEGKVIGSISV
jgi:hypothetical protein